MIGDRTHDKSPRGMRFEFACTYAGGSPPDLGYTGLEVSGWEVRRKIIEWCKRKGINQYQIVRNTTYVKDLHGPAVYELYIAS